MKLNILEIMIEYSISNQIITNDEVTKVLLLFTSILLLTSSYCVTIRYNTILMNQEQLELELLH